MSALGGKQALAQVSACSATLSRNERGEQEREERNLPELHRWRDAKVIHALVVSRVNNPAGNECCPQPTLKPEGVNGGSYSMHQDRDCSRKHKPD